MRGKIIGLCALLLVMILPTLGACGDGMAPEGREIADFLNDEHVNAVLWEEWNIYDEWVYVRSLYENSPRLVADFNKLWHQERALANRARQNYQDLLGVNPPHPLRAFWDDISAWPKQFDEWYNTVRTPGNTWLLEQANRKHAEAWLELKSICREYDINMDWPLPRQSPSSVGGGSMPPIPTYEPYMPPIPSGR